MLHVFSTYLHKYNHGDKFLTFLWSDSCLNKMATYLKNLNVIKGKMSRYAVSISYGMSCINLGMNAMKLKKHILKGFPDMMKRVIDLCLATDIKKLDFN